ncbi:MAG: zinc-binding dehydrogenase, partial [Acetanaerobacterium sp.]
MQHYKASVLVNEKKIEFRELELKAPLCNQVLVKVDSCAICTLEQRIYSGSMKRYPFAGGHEVSGIVKSVGESVKSIGCGEKVVIRLLNACGECYYCRSGHENQCETAFLAATHDTLSGPGGLAEYLTVDAKNVYRVPDGIDLSHAALTEPLACCVHSVQKADIRLGDDVVVIGIGIMGALHIQLAKLRGARVIACERDETRLDVARRMGADVLIHSEDGITVQTVLDMTEGRGADVVFCTAAAPAAAKESVEMAGKLGRVVLYSSFHPDEPISLNVNKVHSTEVVITGAVNPDVRDFQTACRLLASGLIDVSQ